MLRDYQQEVHDKAYITLMQYGLVYLSMQMRTGKTLTSLTLADGFNPDSVLFVTKKKAIGSIRADYEKGGFKYPLTVINYESVHKMEPHHMYILDEAHSLGAYPKPCLAYKRLKKLTPESRIIYLSGTPSPESYSQLFHQLHLSSYSPWRHYKNFYRWADEYVLKGTKYLGSHTVTDYSNAIYEKVWRAVGHLFVGLTQQEAGFESKVRERILEVGVDPRIAPTTAKLIKDRIYEFNDGDIILADTPVKLQNKIHQLHSGTVITENGTKILDLSKAEYIRDRFRGKKIAIYYIFKAELEAIKRVFGKDRLTDSPEEFEQNTDKIFVGQIQSASEGVKLLSADALVFYNIGFSSTKYQQAIERMSDYTRQKDAEVYWIFATNGIEHKIYQAVQDKQDYTNSYFRRDYL